jgi:hypothetical protein
MTFSHEFAADLDARFIEVGFSTQEYCNLPFMMRHAFVNSMGVLAVYTGADGKRRVQVLHPKQVGTVAGVNFDPPLEEPPVCSG